jgi:hypothetical protein
VSFRTGTKNPQTVYWSAPDEPDRFVAVAMSGTAARAIADALNRLRPERPDTLLTSLPIVPARGSAE